MLDAGHLGMLWRRGARRGLTRWHQSLLLLLLTRRHQILLLAGIHVLLLL